MSTKSFQVFFTGNLRAGTVRREAIALLADRFRLDFKQVKRLLSSGGAVVKRCDGREEAEKLVCAFGSAGWEAEVREVHNSGALRKNSGADRREPIAFRTVTSTNDKFALSVPVHWEEMSGLNVGAIIQVGSVAESEFCIVLSQQVGLPETDASIADYCSAQLQQCAEQVSCGAVTRAATKLPTKSGAGYFGEITAEIDSVPVAYLVACSRHGNRVYTQFLWCELREYQQKKALLQRVVVSFRPVSSVVGRKGKPVGATVVSLY